MVKTNLGKVSIVFKGEYNPSTEYKQLDAITYNGSSYGVKKDCVGITPPNDECYMILAEKGEKGEQGIQGVQGLKGDKGDQGIQGEKGEQGIQGETGLTPNIQIGTVTTVEPDQQADVTITGTTENPILNFNIPKGKEGVTLNELIETYYALRRTGKIYQTKIYKSNFNPTSSGEKMFDNAGLQFEPSTDTYEGIDDYLNGQHPLFEWVNVNYVREADGTAILTAIEGMEGYKTEGSVDVGVMQMSFWWNWDTSNPEYDLVTISDMPHSELDLKPWCECVKADGTVLPYCIGSKYFSGIANDGLLRSQPNLKPARNQSHNNMITNYQKKGEGYWGAGAERNLFQIIFNIIKGATKNSQNLYRGCTDYNRQYNSATEEQNVTYITLKTTEADNLLVGSNVSLGEMGDNTSKDRGLTYMHNIADSVKILKIEAVDDTYSKVFIDSEPFNVTLTTVLSTMPWVSSNTDKVMRKHDGSFNSNTSGKTPYRVQGREYAIGSYVIASNTVMFFQSDSSKNVYVAKKGVAHSSDKSTILENYQMIGNIPNYGGDWWIGDIAVDCETGALYPKVRNSSSSQGFGDKCVAGGITTSGSREFMQGGYFAVSSLAGSAYLNCGGYLNGAYWNFSSCD